MAIDPRTVAIGGGGVKSSIKSFEDNLKDFRRVHGDRYEYPEETKRAKDKFNVFCSVKDHGLFSISADNHKKGKGCPKCARENRPIISPEENIKILEKIHNYFYKYLEQPGKDDNKFTVTCPIHGPFLIRLSNHKMGDGCKDCAILKRTLKQRRDLLDIEKLNEIHNNKYSYSKSKYINRKTPITITCPQHRRFLTTLMQS